MRIAIISATAFAAIAAAAPAAAQDTDKGFTGPRAEAVVGWDRVDSSDTDASDGVVYGVQLGYDYDLGSAVVGVEAEATDSSIKETEGGVLVAGDSLTAKAGRDLYLGGRLGFKATPGVLVYAKAGYSNARIGTDYTAPGTTVSTKDNLDGWRVGAGAEVKLSGNVYAKAEYRYSSYNELDGYSIDLNRHQVVGGVGIRF